MSRRVPGRRWCCLLMGCVILLAGRVDAQVASPVEPRWFRMRFPEFSLGMEAEGLRENVDLGSSTSLHEQYSIVPLVGLRTSGSIYHPNLLTFDFNGEGGWGWLKDTYQSPGSVETRYEDDALRRYLLQVNLFTSKPYNGSFVAVRDHTFRNYDVFSTYTVDTVRYSGRASWMTGAFELNADAGFRNDTSVGLTDVSDIAETYFSFNGAHRRTTGQTTLIYRYDEFENTYNYGPTQNSVNHTVSISDSETFGSRRQGTSTTGASYSEYEYSGLQTETITANEDLTFQHRPNLDSFLTAHYNHSSMDPVTTEQFQGTAGVRHRLYDSLTSTLDAHGTHDSSSSSFSSSSNDRYGLGLHENYTKHLGPWGRLTLGGGIIADHENHEASGRVLPTLGERHQLYLFTSTNYQPAFLSQPRVITATIEVFGPGGIVATENVDYRVIPIGERTEIRLVLGSVVLRDGDVVTVNYLSASLYNAEFESFNTTAEIRLDLFNRVGVYGRFNWLDNNAPPSALTETLTDLVGGAEFYWRWLRVGGEYESYDSNFSQYEAQRFFQTVTWQPSSASTLGVDFSENFYQYPGDQHQTRYQALLRYNTQLSYALAWYVEGGYSFQDVVGAEQNLAAARTGLNWVWGKLTLRAGYQYNYQTTMTGLAREQRDRNYFFAYLKRTF